MGAHWAAPAACPEARLSRLVRVDCNDALAACAGRLSRGPPRPLRLDTWARAVPVPAPAATRRRGAAWARMPPEPGLARAPGMRSGSRRLLRGCGMRRRRAAQRLPERHAGQGPAARRGPRSPRGSRAAPRAGFRAAQAAAAAATGRGGAGTAASRRIRAARAPFSHYVLAARPWRGGCRDRPPIPRPRPRPPRRAGAAGARTKLLRRFALRPARGLRSGRGAAPRSFPAMPCPEPGPPPRRAVAAGIGYARPSAGAAIPRGAKPGDRPRAPTRPERAPGRTCRPPILPCRVA